MRCRAQSGICISYRIVSQSELIQRNGPSLCLPLAHLSQSLEPRVPGQRQARLSNLTHCAASPPLYLALLGVQATRASSAESGRGVDNGVAEGGDLLACDGRPPRPRLASPGRASSLALSHLRPHRVVASSRSSTRLETAPEFA